MTKKVKKTNSKNSQINTGILVLENKKVFRGIGIGYRGEATGEVCFNTSLTGYQEIISDPSYAEQIINFTFPHIGNVGTNREDYESDKIWTKGAIFLIETYRLQIFILAICFFVLDLLFWYKTEQSVFLDGIIGLFKEVPSIL